MVMGLLKRLTEMTSQNGKATTLDPPQIIEKEKKTYHEDGFITSRACQGLAHNLEASLDNIYQKFENECKTNFNEQEKLKQPYISEQKGKKTALLNKTEELERTEKKIEKIDEDIEKLNHDCRKVRTHPEDYLIDVDKRASAKFWIGISFLIPLAFYIFIFYISTSYSAFFREFSLGSGFVEGIFYPQALTNALSHGPLELGFILFIPFVFFGLGYLVHMFQEKKGITNKFKIAMLYLITFLFDAILAYLIEEKLYNLNKTFDSEPFNIVIASQSVSFWVIIFAGFVSYIVWGLVFDFVMKEHADRDKVKSFIQSKKEEILSKEKTLQKINETIDKIEEEMSNLKVRISVLQNIIDGFILPVMNYKALSTEYFQGWQQYIAAELRLGRDEQDKALLECREVYNKHIKSLELDTDTYQNKVYTKTL